MAGCRILARLAAGALLFTAVLARADQPLSAPPEDQPAEATVEVPQRQPADDVSEPTWFGMGFESRQERFRRDMGMPAGQSGGSGHGAGPRGGGPGGGR